MKQPYAVIIVISFIMFVVVLFYTLKGDTMKQFSLASSAFEHNQPIPQQFSCKGENVSPPLTWHNAPQGTKSFALIVDDPDAPQGTWVHWVVFNLPAPVTNLEQNSNIESLGGIQGTTSFESIGYGGPCPPSGTHRYFFKLYAVDTMLNLKRGSSKEELLAALEGHILAQTELVGLFSHS